MSAPRMDFVRPLGAGCIAFPRSADDLTLGYMTSYRVDHKDTMREWVDQQLADLPDDKADHAHGVAYQNAKAEIGRPLRTPESKLLSEATRDWINQRETMRRNGVEAGR